MGERTALWSQQNSTDWGKSPKSSAPVQDADQGEQAARGVDVDLGLAVQPFLQDRAPSLWMPRRAMSMASIWLGGRRLTASK
jgi:hypothetical protein